MSHRTRGFPEYGMTNAKFVLSEALPLTATPNLGPKGVNPKWATQLTLIYVKATRLKKVS